MNNTALDELKCRLVQKKKPVKHQMHKNAVSLPFPPRHPGSPHQPAVPAPSQMRLQAAQGGLQARPRKTLLFSSPVATKRKNPCLPRGAGHVSTASRRRAAGRAGRLGAERADAVGRPEGAGRGERSDSGRAGRPDGAVKPRPPRRPPATPIEHQHPTSQPARQTSSACYNGNPQALRTCARSPPKLSCRLRLLVTQVRSALA